MSFLSFVHEPSHSRKTFRAVAALTFLGLAVLAGAAELPVPPAVLKSRFPQKKLGDCSFAVADKNRATTPIGVGNLTIRRDEHSFLSIESFDHRGKPWRFTLNQGDSCNAWQSDLDSNGQPDLILLTVDSTPEGNAGTLTVLLLDADGQPLPWQATGYFDADDKGVRQLVDINQDGHAEIVYAYKEGNRFDGVKLAVFLYRAQDAGWTKLEGSQGGVKFPIILSSDAGFTKRRQQVDLSSGFDSNADGSTINSLDFEDDRISLSNGKQIHRPDMVVVDSADGSRIASTGEMKRLLVEAKASGLAVRYTGQSCEEESCRPFLLWARPAR